MESLLTKNQRDICAALHVSPEAYAARCASGTRLKFYPQAVPSHSFPDAKPMLGIKLTLLPPDFSMDPDKNGHDAIRIVAKLWKLRLGFALFAYRGSGVLRFETPPFVPVGEGEPMTFPTLVAYEAKRDGTRSLRIGLCFWFSLGEFQRAIDTYRAFTLRFYRRGERYGPPNPGSKDTRWDRPMQTHGDHYAE